MAEIGLVASIFGVAAFGTKVAKSLYETGDVMIHAHQQIASMAKHVSQFTAVLRHLGRVLDAEKGNCSEDLLRDIRKLKRSCKGTFKEINATIRSRRLRPFVPVRWLFKKSKAKELEARLDSEQSMLQTMIQSVTVSKLGDMQSRSKADSQQISVLRQELDLLKTLIIENYKSAAELRRAEQSTQAEESYPPEFNIDTPARDPSPTPSSHISSSPSSDDEAEELRASDLQHEGVPNIQALAAQSLRPIDNNAQSGTHQASSMLLQMIPYRPISSNPANLDRSGRLIAFGPTNDENSGDDTKPSMEEATKSVRLLLDKWTTSGSAPVSEMLNEAQAQEDNRREAKNARYRRDRRFGHPVSDISDDGLDNRGFFPPSNKPHPHMPRSTPHQRPHQIVIEDVWRNARLPARSTRDSGGHLLNALRSNGGGIVYMKRNDFQCSYHLDNIQFYTFYLLPPQLNTPDKLDPLFTEIGKGWVRQEALDLLGYTYTETQSGHFSISGNLELTEIEELVRLSYQGFYRGLQKVSNETIEKRSWRKKIDDFSRVYPGMPYAHPPPPPPPVYRNPYTGYDDLLHEELEGLYGNWDSQNYQGPTVSAPGVQEVPLPTAAQNGDPTGKTVRVDPAKEGKPLEPELRFTIPGSKPSLRHPPVPPSQKNETDTRALELREARTKLDLLLKKKDEAEKAKNFAMAADLTYYAIPDMKRKIEELERSRQENQKPSPERKQTHARPTEVETDSSGSSDDEGGSKA